MADWRTGFRKQIEYCAYCPKLCRFACPVAQAECSETVTPTAKQTILKLVRDGALPFDREVGELVYMCCGCLITRPYCEHEIEVYPCFEAARAEAVERGVAPEAAMTFEKKWAQRGNPFNADLAAVLARHVSEKHHANGRTVLFTGCSTTHHFPDQVADIAAVMEAIGREFSVFTGDSICCGYPLLTLGHKEAFERQARKVAAGLRGAELVLSPCPTCAHMLKTRYRELGFALDARVMHVTEFVAENLARLTVRKPEPRPTIYHDPCHLGRYLGVYDEPRRILEAALGKAPLEFFEARERGTCCGGGGGLPVVKPETARKIAHDKAATIPEYGALLLATACPMCRRMLGMAGRETNIPADDVISILRRSLET
ncbi:MAG TPA: (Fe-S)-binding protein [bacterium]|nr:(Fe-S)-binding protein [bacterium]